MSKNTGRIRIVKIPEGPWPVEIRVAWVDLVFPCDPVFQRNENRGGRMEALVSQDAAIKVLEERMPDAAEFWKSKGLPESDAYFAFGDDEVEVIHDSVSYPKIIEVPEEAQGNVNR